MVPVGDDDPGWDHFCQAEKLIEDEDMGPNSAFIASPALRAELRRRALWNEGSGQTLWDNLTNPISSKAISGEQEHIFFGNFPVGMVIGIWGEAADIVVNRFTSAHAGLTEIVVFLWCSLAIRTPRLFGVMTLPIRRGARQAEPAPQKAEGPPEEEPRSWTGEEKEKPNNKRK